VLQRLEGSPQYKALVEAANDHGGYVTRSRVLKIAGRDADANLNGFRKPFGTVVKHLAGDGLDMPEEEFPFWADYDGGTTAVGFYIDEASLPVVRAALED